MPAHFRRSLCIRLFVLLGLILGHTWTAVAAEWTWIGLDGGTVNVLVLRPGSSNVLYAGTQGGVFKSQDSGATWSSASQGLPAAAVLDIAIDPAHPATMYAGIHYGGVYRSTDGGAHWTFVGAGLPRLAPTGAEVFALAVAPGGPVYAGTDLGVYRSRDGGATWQAVNQGIPEILTVFALEIHPSRPEILFAGIAGKGIYRSTDGGAHWARAGGASPDASVYEIAFSPASSKIAYAATNAGVFRSFDSGANWLPSAAGAPTVVTSVAAHLTLPGTVYAGTSNGVYRSTDRGATWVRIARGLSDPAVQTVAIDPANPRVLWTGTGTFDSLGGVFQSTDAGAHWTFRSRGLSALAPSALAIDPQMPTTLFAAFGPLGLARSRDRGLHWSLLPTPEGISISDVEVDPLNSSIVYAAGGPLLRSTDGGDTWARLETAPTTATFSEVEIDPANPLVLYAGSGGHDGFHKSTDAGTTWFHSPSATWVRPRQLEIAPGILYAIAEWPPFSGTPSVNRFAMYRSRDAGQTWEEVLHIDRNPRSLAVSPSDPETVYAALLDGTITRSTDGGDAWQTVSQLASAAALAISAGTPETLYAAVPGQGVLASTDGGASWSSAGQGLPGLAFGELVLDPQEPSRLYVTVNNGGLAALHEPDECVPGPTVLCLQGARFHVEVAWADFQGNTGFGQVLPLTDETGGFWFFEPTNLELFVKVLDGRDTNGKFWVFAGSLTSVEFTLTMTDTETGKQRVYRNPSGKMASFGDTGTF